MTEGPQAAGRRWHSMAPTDFPEGAEIGVDGVWRQVLRPPRPTAPRPALFLDRDGVIVAEVGYLRTASEVRLLSSAATAIAAANARGIAVVIVTNQSGLGRGLFGWPDFIAVQARILGDLAARGAHVDGVFACPHHPQARPPFNAPDHPARKPSPGMLLSAARRLRLDLGSSWIVGDHPRDIEAGYRAGLAGGMLVATGFGADAEAQKSALAYDAPQGFSVRLGASIADALALPLFGRRSRG